MAYRKHSPPLYITESQRLQLIGLYTVASQTYAQLSAIDKAILAITKEPDGRPWDSHGADLLFEDGDPSAKVDALFSKTGIRVRKKSR